MNQLALTLQLLELVTKLGPVVASVATVVSQIEAAAELVHRLQTENRDPTAAELASLDATFARARADLDTAIVQSSGG